MTLMNTEKTAHSNLASANSQLDKEKIGDSECAKDDETRLIFNKLLAEWGDNGVDKMPHVHLCIYNVVKYEEDNGNKIDVAIPIRQFGEGTPRVQKVTK